MSRRKRLLAAAIVVAVAGGGIVRKLSQPPVLGDDREIAWRATRSTGST